MAIDRRRLLAASALTGVVPGAMALPKPAAAAPLSSFGIDATQLGVRAGGVDDQTRALQRAIDQTAGARVPLLLGPGVYLAGDLKLPAGAQIFGIRGATRLIFTQGPSLLSARNVDHVTLSGLLFEGSRKALPEGRGLVQFEAATDIRISDCEILNSSRHGLKLEAVAGIVADNIVDGSAETAIHSLNARGLNISSNIVRNAGNNGIQVWRSEKGDDGTQVLDNRIENV